MKALAILALLAFPAEAWACRLALVLAVDVSKSVDSMEFALQFGGLTAAFRDAEVREAILAAEPVAVAAFEWSAEDHQRAVADWTLLLDAAAIDRLAARFAAHERASPGMWTSIGAALAHARGVLAAGPDCARLAVDLSGDGYQNDGPSPRQTYAAVDFDGVTVNALVVGGALRPELTDYFRREVIRGPGAFAEETVDFTDYAEAIRRKLLRELSPDIDIAKGGG